MLGQTAMSAASALWAASTSSTLKEPGDQAQVASPELLTPVTYASGRRCRRTGFFHANIVKFSPCLKALRGRLIAACLGSEILLEAQRSPGWRHKKKGRLRNTLKVCSIQSVLTEEPLKA